MEALTDSVIARLKAEMPSYTVEGFPDVPNRYPFAAARQTLLVAYEGSDYAAPNAMSPLSQDRTPSITVTLLVRSLRGPAGASATIESIVDALIGWRPPVGGAPMAIVRDEFVSEEQGVWRFVVTARCSMPRVRAEVEPSGTPIVSVGLLGTP